LNLLAGNGATPQAFLLPEYIDEKEMEGKDFDLADRDSLFEDAARLIVQNTRSVLHRCFNAE